MGAVNICIYHNILWSRYKGAIFSELHKVASEEAVTIAFVQIAETETSRVGLGGLDLSYHQYPYTLLFEGAYGNVSKLKIVWSSLKDLVRRQSELVVLPGYDRAEFWVMLVACILLNRKRAVFCDSTFADRPRRGPREFAKRWFFRHVNHVFAYGQRAREYLLHYGVPETKITDRCQAAALPSDYDASSVLAHYQSPLGIQQGPPRLLYVGRLSPEKGVADLLHAMKLLEELLPKALLTIIGTGPEKERLIETAAALGLTNAIEFAGPKRPDEIAKYLITYDLLALPSHSEPWGLVVNEALSFGCPVVVSNICGCVPELVREGITGYTFRLGDKYSLRDAISKTFELSRARRPAVAADCIGAMKSFTPHAAALRILDGCKRSLYRRH